DFVRWFETKYPGQQPYGKNMPVSSSQILHPERYAAHETPVNITIRGGAGDVLQYDDDLGEFETRLVLEQALGSEDEAEALTVGWAGDHYAVLGAHNEALVWYAVWRTPAAASAFVSGLKRAWAKRAEPGKTWRAERTTLGTTLLRLSPMPPATGRDGHTPPLRPFQRSSRLTPHPRAPMSAPRPNPNPTLRFNDRGSPIGY